MKECPTAKSELHCLRFPHAFQRRKEAELKLLGELAPSESSCSPADEDGGLGCDQLCLIPSFFGSKKHVCSMGILHLGFCAHRLGIFHLRREPAILCWLLAVAWLKNCLKAKRRQAEIRSVKIARGFTEAVHTSFELCSWAQLKLKSSAKDKERSLLAFPLFPRSASCRVSLVGLVSLPFAAVVMLEVCVHSQRVWHDV